MNTFNKKNLKSQLRILFNLTSYLQHPELKLTTPKEKWRLIMTMRDLRFWMIENAPHSSRNLKLTIELEKLNRELHYLQFRGNFISNLELWKRTLIFVTLSFLFLMLGPQHLSGHMGLYDRPV